MSRTRTPHRGRSPRASASVGWLCVVAFAVTVAVLGIQQVLPWWLIVLDGVASICAFGVYAFDKNAAVGARRRVPEQTLLIVGLLGGWPGAFIAQRVFRHKTRKRAFQVAFWITVALNIALTVVLASQYAPG